uniref:PHD-type domain-containing protein n=1 Tax=Kalanchoe fedtschenkoi TaxID=63787 RepID=A0A7N0ZV51_KALFE
MANGTDWDQFVVMTKAKSGLKREFEFAVKSQSQISGTTRRMRSLSGNGGLSESEEKRLRTAEREEEVEVEVERVVVTEENAVASTASDDSMKSAIVDPASDDERRSVGFIGQKVWKDGWVGVLVSGGAEQNAGVGSQEEKPVLHYARTKKKSKGKETADRGLMNEENLNLEAEHGVEKDEASKVKLSKAPKNLKELLETGLLDGVPVKYQRSMKAKEAGEQSGLRGVIRRPGILCFCVKCKGTEVVPPLIFECHAGSSNKRPPEYIFLENRKSLRDVMNACKNLPVDSIEETIRKAIASPPQSRATVTGSFCDSRTQISTITPSRNHAASVTDRSAGEAVSFKPLSRVSSEGSSSRSNPEWKITKKDLGLHKSVFQDGLLPDGTEVTYVANKEKLRGGYISGIGICCECCNKVISPSQFEAHAGRGAHRKPFHNIYISIGISFHQLAIRINLNRSSIKGNDKLCKICGEGGDLICCGGCPRSFHEDCAPSISTHNGIWYCRICESNQKGKFDNPNALAAGRVPGVDPMEQIINRSIRIIQVGEVEIGGCILCRSPTFDKEFGSHTVIICDQCEREYHVGCLKDHGIADLKEEPKGDWFCCQGCERIHSSVLKLVANGEERLPDSLLSAIQKNSEHSKDSGSRDSIDVNWRILRGKTVSNESEPLLLTAVDILQENFGHIVDPATNIDLIPAMVNGEELQSQDFGGMYCAVLTVKSAVVSVVVFRIRGMELAEMPLVATSSNVHGKGYFQTLYACLERFFGFVKVQKIVLPAAEGAEAIWNNKFGFTKMSEEELKPYMNDYHLMNFQGLPWFNKAVPKVRIVS